MILTCWPWTVLLTTIFFIYMHIVFNNILNSEFRTDFIRWTFREICMYVSYSLPARRQAMVCMHSMYLCRSKYAIDIVIHKLNSHWYSYKVIKFMYTMRQSRLHCITQILSIQSLKYVTLCCCFLQTKHILYNVKHTTL